MQKLKKYRLALIALAPLMLGAATYEGAEDSPYTRLTLSGKGYAEQTAEFVAVSAATETFSTSASRAMSDNAVDMGRLKARLAQMGVAKGDFRTSNFNFQPGTGPRDHNGDHKDGFTVRHQLSILVRDADKVGAVMDALVDAGAKNLSVNRYWGYSQEISPQVLQQARAGAIRDAQAKAQDYARVLGMRIRRVVSINDQGGYSRDEPMRWAAVSADVATRIETRPQTVLASVGMVFELEK